MVEENSNKKKPVFKAKVGSCDVSVWENVTKNGDVEAKFLTVSSHRNYKDKDEWKTTNSLRVNDIPSMILALQKAYEFAKIKKDD